MKKRLVALVLAGLMCAAVCAGCSPQDSTAGGGAQKPGQVSGAQAGGTDGAASKVAVIFTGRYEFFADMETAQREVAAQAGNVRVDFFESKDDINTQLQQVATCASGGYDALVVNLVAIDSVQEVIDAAGGLPIVFVNRLPDESVLQEGKYVYVGSDESEAGSLQAQYIAERFKDRQRLDVVMMMGTLGLANTVARTDALRKGLVDAGFEVNYVFDDTGEYDRAKAMDKMQQFLGTGKGFDVVVANNDDMALGCMEALRAAGMGGKPVVGIDANKEAMTAIGEGTMAASVFQDAVGQGKGSMQAVIDILDGKPVGTLNWIPFQLVTRDNLADFT